jgi:hypothetical protein
MKNSAVTNISLKGRSVKMQKHTKEVEDVEAFVMEAQELEATKL